jgi:hypothetical protein
MAHDPLYINIQAAIQTIINDTREDQIEDGNKVNRLVAYHNSLSELSRTIFLRIVIEEVDDILERQIMEVLTRAEFSK